MTTIGSLFSGYGGLDMGVQLALGTMRTAWVSDIEPGPQTILTRRYPHTPNLGDITSVDWGSVEPVDILVGGSPCFPAGTLIDTTHGYKPIEQISTSDYVRTHTGRYKRVTSTMSRQASDTYTVKVMGAPEFITTSEHPFYARKKSQKWNNEIRRYDRIWADPEWVASSELTKDHFIGYQLDKRNENVLPIGVDRAYLFGRWLGDGWLRTAKRTSTTPPGQRGSRINSQWWQVFICSSHEEAGELELAIKKAGYTAARFDTRTVTKFRISSKELVQELEHFGRGARGKRVPGWAYCLPIEEQEALLNGWIDADGSYTQGKFKITTVSEQLAHGMARIARNVYQRAVSVHKAIMPSTCVIEGRTVNQSDQYQVVIPESNREAFTGDGWVWAPVRKSEPLNERMIVHNLSVEEDESYTAWGITVHNCQDLSTAGQRAGMKPGTRSGLWESMTHAIEQLQPRLVVWENVRGALSAEAYSDSNMGFFEGLVDERTPSQRPAKEKDKPLRALGRVLGDLANLGYDAEWTTVRASDVGAPHRRERVFVIAYPHGERPQGWFESRFPSPEDTKLGSNRALLPTPTVGDKGGPEARSGEGFGAPLGEIVRLLRTPCASEAAGGPLHPEVAKSRNQTLRLTGQVLAATGNLADSSGNTDNSWGVYAPAIRRWEQVLGRSAPDPTEPSRTGKPQLSPAFVEWMMGLPAGWVTDVPISRTGQLRALGNGVVPQQAAYAITEIMNW